MARRWRKRLLIAITVPPLLVCCYDRLWMIAWVGDTNLEVAFAVTDAATGRPVLGASVDVQSDGGLYEERDKQAFVLTAGDDSIARKECRNSMCFGTQSGLCFTDTFVVHSPLWQYRVKAVGYNSTEWDDLDVPALHRLVRRDGPNKVTLVVPVSLTEKQF